MNGTITIPHLKLSKSNKKDICDLCGEKEYAEWESKLPLMLCRECALSNNYSKSKEWLYVEDLKQKLKGEK